jgi:hypothetical protein
MRVRFVCLVVGVLLVPAAAYADSHNADFYGGAAYGGGGSKIGGFIVALGKDWLHGETPRLTPGEEPIKFFIGGVGGSSVQFGSHEGRQLTRIVWGAGPRLTLTKPDTRHFFHIQAQWVGIYSNDGLDQEQPNDKGLAVGGAWDFSLHGAKDMTEKGTHVYGMGIRVQADRIFNGGDRGSVWRVSAGLIYRSPRRE